MLPHDLRRGRGGDLGADEGQVARDPDLKREVEKRTHRSFQKSAPDPLHPASEDEE